MWHSDANSSSHKFLSKVVPTKIYFLNDNHKSVHLRWLFARNQNKGFSPTLKVLVCLSHSVAKVIKTQNTMSLPRRRVDKTIKRFVVAKRILKRGSGIILMSNDNILSSIKILWLCSNFGWLHTFIPFLPFLSRTPSTQVASRHQKFATFFSSLRRFGFMAPRKIHCQTR